MEKKKYLYIPISPTVKDALDKLKVIYKEKSYDSMIKKLIVNAQEMYMKLEEHFPILANRLVKEN